MNKLVEEIKTWDKGDDDCTSISTCTNGTVKEIDMDKKLRKVIGKITKRILFNLKRLLQDIQGFDIVWYDYRKYDYSDNYQDCPNKDFERRVDAAFKRTRQNTYGSERLS